MFDGLVPGYDLVNRLVSLGLDRGWRRMSASLLSASPSLVVDLAAGTGDQAQAVLAVRPGCRVLALDRSAAMVERLGRRLGTSVDVVRADALCVPLADGCADGVTMSFGLRNVADPGALLVEVRRILRPGGRVVLLETGLPRGIVCRTLLRGVLHGVAPLVGLVVTGRAGPYRYLARSVDRFAEGGSLASRLAAADLRVVEERSLALGAVSLVAAERRTIP